MIEDDENGWGYFNNEQNLGELKTSIAALESGFSSVFKQFVNETPTSVQKSFDIGTITSHLKIFLAKKSQITELSALIESLNNSKVARNSASKTDGGKRRRVSR